MPFRRSPFACALALPISLFVAQSAAPVPDRGGPEPLDAADAARVDETVGAFMHEYEVPALSIAIAKEGRLVFARGYGHADAQGEQPVTPASLFRIASISKTFTAAAVMQLVEQGKLSLSDRVFGEGALLGTRYGNAPYGPGIESITVEELLTHTAGGWSNDGRDPMFREPEDDHAALIGWVLDTQPLSDPPGEKYAYSNFGYCVLGRVVEAVSGTSYADFVREHLLAPAGIEDMRIAGDTLEERRPQEVVYVQAGADPYGMRVARMDAHGGWIASAVDLLRFAVRMDGFDTVPDLLRPETIRVMTTPSAANAHYAKGWSVNEAHNWWHTGSLPGTGSILVRAQNGFCWAVLTNHRAGGGFGSDLDRLTWRILERVERWPAGAEL